MITSLSWLKNHLTTKANLNQISERLTEIGLEVENIKSSNSNLDNFIVCKILKSQKHPNADKLKLCEVDIGSGNLVKVVCGAQNARDGLFAVYAPPGASPARRHADLREDADGQDDHPRGRGQRLDREREGEDPGQGGHPAGPAAADLRGEAAGGRPHAGGLQHSEVYS